MEGLNRVYGRGLDYVLVPGSFRPNGATGVVANSTKGQGFSVARTSTGLYTVTFEEKWPAKGSTTKGPGLISFLAGLRVAAATAPAFANGSIVSQSARTAQIRVFAAATGAITEPTGLIDVELGAAQEQDGTTLADFAAGPTPGWSAGDESGGIRWGTHANPDPISTQFIWPADLDASQNATVTVIAAKVGATLADAVTWKIELFNNLTGVLYDADADFGGTSSAMTGDAATKTVQECTLTITAANITGMAGKVTTLTIQPTDGTLGTDDVILLGLKITYVRSDIATTGQVWALTDLTADADNEVNFLAMIQDSLVAA